MWALADHRRQDLFLDSRRSGQVVVRNWTFPEKPKGLDLNVRAWELTTGTKVVRTDEHRGWQEIVSICARDCAEADETGAGFSIAESFWDEPSWLCARSLDSLKDRRNVFDVPFALCAMGVQPPGREGRNEFVPVKGIIPTNMLPYATVSNRCPSESKAHVHVRPAAVSGLKLADAQMVFFG